MQLSDTTNYTGLIQDVVFLITGNSADTLADYTTVDRKRNINKWYQRCHLFILEAMDDWKFHGDWATCATVADQAEYTFPSDILHINKVEIRYDSGDEQWVEAKPIDERVVGGAISNESDLFTEGNPRYWKPDTLSLVFDPVPDTSIDTGIRIWFNKEITELSSNSDEPIVAEPFHRILSIGAAFDYAVSKNMTEKMNILRRELYGTETHPEFGLIMQLKKFYSKRSREKQTRIKPRFQRYK